MKKTYFIIAAFPLLALLATSCAEERVESRIEGDTALSFKAAAGKQTAGRAGETDLTDLQADGVSIAVRSYKEGDETVTEPYREFSLSWNGTAWSYGTPQPHPFFGLTHYAIYPALGVPPDASYDEGSGIMVEAFDYMIAPTAATQADLMVASARTSNTDAASATATLTFRHILSQVNFAIKGALGIRINITNIRVVGVQNTGTYTFGNLAGWTPAATPTTADYAYTPAVTAATDGSEDILYLGNTGAIGAGADNTRSNALMLMPQTFETGSAAGILFDFSLRDMSNTEFYRGQDIKVDFLDYGISQWESGKRYLFILALNPVELRFDVVPVEGWIDGDSPTVPIT